MKLLAVLVGALALVAAAAPPLRQSSAARVASGHLRPQGDAEAVAAVFTSAEEQRQPGVVVTGAAPARSETPGWQRAALYLGGGLVGVAVVAGAAYFWHSRGSQEQEKEEAAGPAAEASEAAAGAVLGGEDNKAGGGEVASVGEKAFDYEKLFRAMAQKTAQHLGPKLAKGQAVRDILENRITGFAGKAKAFVLNELNGTAGALLRAVEAEEAMLLLDWNDAVAANFPPVSVLIAGLLSPSVLAISLYAHILQLILVLLPILGLCSWAIVTDYGTRCSVPTIYIWVYGQGGLALILSVAHTASALVIVKGKAVLREKTEAMQTRMHSSNRTAGEEMDLKDMRELFICSSVLLEQALLVEDTVRSSIWHTIIGAGTAAWLIMTIWCFVITLGWTFVPGVVAFHPSTKLTAPEAYCGAWATVFTMRLSCVLSVLFTFLNVATVAQWVMENLIHSKGFSNNILEKARKFDEGMLGFPVAELLVKALLLRGSADLKSSQLTIMEHERATLEAEREELRSRLEALDGRIEERRVQSEALKLTTRGTKSADLEASIDSLEAFSSQAADVWHEKGLKAAANAESLAASVELATTEDLERMIQKVVQVAQKFQESEAVKEALGKAQAAADAGMQRATEAAEQLRQSEAVQSALGQAAGMAEQLQSGVEQNETLRLAMSQAQQAAEVGRAQIASASGQLQQRAEGGQGPSA
mmetsp:Transcript_124599/g.265766  ORF Transcript_124599/g.265766 Transcript_124599/m.265766 type:complete len:702 (+) Transcript_124599:65-2170(+)